MALSSDRLAASRQDWLGWVLIGGCVLLIGAAFGAAAWLQAGKRVVDPETLCPVDGPPPAHVVFLIDKTDPLTHRRVETLTAELHEARRSLGLGERLSVFLIHDRVEADFSPLFSRCSPGRGAQANELYENPRRIQRVFDQAFGEPVEQALAELVRATTAPRSPILEAIRLVAEWPPFRDASRRRLVVVSDLLQNVESLSHYQPLPPFQELARGDYLSRVLPDLEAVEVSLQLIERPVGRRVRSLQDTEHAAFWDGYFMAAGAQRVP